MTGLVSDLDVHLLLWTTEKAEKFALNTIEVTILWYLKFELCCAGIGIISTVVTKISTFQNYAKDGCLYDGRLYIPKVVPQFLQAYMT